MRILAIYMIVMLASCTRTKHEQDQLTAESTVSLSKDSVTTAPANPYENAVFEVKTFAVEAGGYGYEIYINGSKTIYQPTIPGLPGNTGFSTQEKAKRTGEFVAHKIRNNQMPPSVTVEELDSIGVLD
jgi:hypothetical protein